MHTVTNLAKGAAWACLGAVATITAAPSAAQQAAPPPDGPLAIPNPTYIAVQRSVEVDRPLEEIWPYIQKPCSIGEWLQAPCEIISGGGELGTVRRINNRGLEVLVAKTRHSYTYALPLRTGVPYQLTHPTVEVEPIGPRRTKVTFTSFYDNSILASDQARADELVTRRARLERVLRNLKTVAEGGRIAPPPK